MSCVCNLKRAAASILSVSLLCCVHAYSSADEAPAQSKHQMMKDCMAKQKAANTGMTQEAMKTVCKNEAKGSQTKDGNDLATAPQSPQK